MGVYAEKRTGGNQYHRSAFLQMIQECRNRNIDIIYTKTIARFGRNQLELLRTLEELTNIGVRVIFELEDIEALLIKADLGVDLSVELVNKIRNEKIKYTHL